VDCTQFLSENRLDGCQIFGRFAFLKLNPNGFSVFYNTPLVNIHTPSEYNKNKDTDKDFISGNYQHLTDNY